MIRRARAALSVLVATWWVRSLRSGSSPTVPPSGILVLWHADMLPCLRAFAHRGMRVLISPSADGDFAAASARHLGYDVVRGSSSRGGVAALKRLARELDAEGGWVAFVADGPRGPRGVCKPGAVWLSRATGRPVVCATTRAPRGVTLGGWARVRVPLPFSRVFVQLSSPFHPETTKELQTMMENLTTGKVPASDLTFPS